MTKVLQRKIPSIKVLNHSDLDPDRERYFEEVICSNLKEVLGNSIYDLEDEEEQINYFKSSLPIIRCSPENKVPSSLSLLFVYKYRLYSSKFIYEIISRWLIPGKRLNMALYFGADFEFVLDPTQRYIMIQIILNIDSEKDLALIKKSLPELSKEIKLGIASFEQGMRILEIKGLNIDDKINLMQEIIVSLMGRKSKYFDRELFIEMQHFFVFSRENFKKLRSCRHMVKIICWNYLFRKMFAVSQENISSKRVFKVKLMKTSLEYPYGLKKVLGVLVAVSFTRENESFGEKQVLRAIQTYMPGVELVPESFLSYKKRGEHSSLLYLEITKKDGLDFTYNEYTALKNILPEDLKDRVEQLVHPIFMPRNEEEIMRNILNLNKQLKSYDDIPQIMIQFDIQDDIHIHFRVILLRVINTQDLPVQVMCEQREFKYEFIPDRIKNVGKLKKGYVKEANVFYVQMKKQLFLRKDHSLDLYRARQAVLSELHRIFINVRDYNGGMIAKESEIFLSFKKHIEKNGTYNEILLENFFYSLNPVIVRSVVAVDLLETSFQMLVDLIQDDPSLGEGFVLKFLYQPHYVFCYLVTDCSHLQHLLNDQLSKLNLSRFQLITSYLQVEDSFYLGLIYQGDRPDERKRFYDVVHKTLENWKNSTER